MGDRYFDLANFAVNNELGDDRRAGAARGLLRASRRRAAGVATLRLMKFMSDFREAMWGVVQTARLGARLRLRRLRGQALRAHARDRRRPRLRDLARGGAWPRAAELPDSRPLRDHRRRGRRDLDRLPPGEARLRRRRPGRARRAHLGLDLPLGRPRRPAARLGLADEDDDALGRASTGGSARSPSSTPAGSSAAGSGSPPARSGWRSCAARRAGRRPSACRWS